MVLLGATTSVSKGVHVSGGGGGRGVLGDEEMDPVKTLTFLP